MTRCARVPPTRLPDPARGETLRNVAAVLAMSRALHAHANPSAAYYPDVAALGFGGWVLPVLAHEAALHMASRPPDQVIDRVGRPYLERWWLVREDAGASYLHRWLGDDPDLGLHDHPADSASLLIEGALRERWLPAGALPDADIRTAHLGPGAVVYRTASHAHQMYVASRDTPLTLFVFGPRGPDAQWGFWVPSKDGAGKVRMRHPFPPVGSGA